MAFGEQAFNFTKKGTSNFAETELSIFLFLGKRQQATSDKWLFAYNKLLVRLKIANK